MSFDTMRITSAGHNSPLADLVMRTLESGGDLTVSGLRAPGFRALAPMFDKAQVQVDKAVVEVGLQRLTFVADLLAEGLTYNLSDPLSITQIEWSQINKTGSAQRTMAPRSRTENRLPIVLPTRLPVYLTTDGFELDVRTLRASQRSGLPLDTTLIKQSTRVVNEAIEDAAINGATTLDGQPLYDSGYSAPGLLTSGANQNTATGTLADWTTAVNGTNIINKVLDMITTLQGDKKFGPYNLYVPTAVGNALNADFKANSDLSVMERLAKIEAGGRPLRVRTVDFMPSTKVVLVQMTSDVVDVVVGQSPTVIPWTSLDGFTIHNLVMAIMVPRVRWDYDGNSGICILTLS